MVNRWIAGEAIDHQGALQNRGELAILLRVLDNGHPSVVLEIGTWSGGLCWALSRVRSVSHIVTVDPSPQPDAPQRLARLACRATQVIGDSRQPTTYDKVLAALDGAAPDVVIIDGDHTYDAAAADWHRYGALVSPGGLVVMHDTQGYPGVDAVQVPQLWAELRQQYPTTELVDIPGGPGGTGIIWR